VAGCERVTISLVSGWFAVALVLLAASLPLLYRVRLHRRAIPGSPTIDAHVAVGLSAAGGALVHTLSVLPSLGAPAVVGAGMLSLAPASAAFFLLFAHVGVGLRLRNPRLRDRPAKRRLHVALAIAIVATVTAHVVALLRAG
jgi:hypothetical protein